MSKREIRRICLENLAAQKHSVKAARANRRILTHGIPNPPNSNRFCLMTEADHFPSKPPLLKKQNSHTKSEKK